HAGAAIPLELSYSHRGHVHGMRHTLSRIQACRLAMSRRRLAHARRSQSLPLDVAYDIGLSPDSAQTRNSGSVRGESGINERPEMHTIHATNLAACCFAAM